MIFTVVIADDITGANDIGIMYAKAGLDAVVYSYGQLEENFVPEHEVTIIDTNSRFSTAREAYERVYRMARRIGPSGAMQFIDKQCSVFRGNIGAEFDAMLDALGEEHAMVVLGFPDNGRTTINGIHYVHDVPLAESQFRNDPVHPMALSSLPAILQGQTKRPVALISYETINQGIPAIKEAIGRLKKEAAYILFDVRDNQDLETLAQVLKDEKIICGSSAIGYYLAKQYAAGHGRVYRPAMQKAGQEKILSIAGSLTPQTKAQTEYIRSCGYPAIVLDTRKLFDRQEKEKEINRVLTSYAGCYNTARLVLIHSMQADAEVFETKQIAVGAGFDNTKASEEVSSVLAELAAIISQRYQIHKFIICGGDTSASFCNRMGITGMKVLHEIEPGLPTCRSITPPCDELVLKSGSFGKESFIETAMQFL